MVRVTSNRHDPISVSRLLSLRSRLPELKAWHASRTTPRHISPSEFSEQFLAQKRPGLFRGLISDAASPFRWPASLEWPQGPGPLGGLRGIDTLQNATVDVEVARVGRGYGEGVAGFSSAEGKNADAWMQLRMPFGLFQDAFIDGHVPSVDADRKRVGYVAQQDLFNIAPTLQTQCPPLPHTSAGVRGALEQWRRNIWIGGAGTFTPIHCDPYENVFAQVVGTKRVHLFPPHCREALYLFDRATTRQANTSSIPTEFTFAHGNEAENAQVYPLLEGALQDADARHAIVQSGDVLYIPQGWFHCIASLSVSASVNAWFR